MQTGFVNQPIELTLTAARSYKDIFNEVEVDVVFRDATGETWRVPAFWAGDNTFRVRFAAPRPGHYTWRSECSEPDDTGLHGRTGELEATAYDGPCALYRHGRLRVADSRRTFEHADGTPFLWLADTWWMGLTKRLDWPHGFRMLAEDRVRKGFNTVQIVAGPLPDFSADTHTWADQQANESGWPWREREGRDPTLPPAPDDFVEINPAFYDLADLRIAALVEAGLMPCIVGMWGYYIMYMGTEKAKRHWRNLVARYAAWPVTWCVCGETGMPNYGCPREKREETGQEQRRRWSRVADEVRGLDPFKNPLTSHPCGGRTIREEVDRDDLLDFNMLQTGHSAHASYPLTMQCVSRSYVTEPPMPFLNSEINYEGIMGGNWHEVQRFLIWTSLLGGACGHTYGAQGIWAMNSRDDPFRGTTFDWGEGYWQDVMHYPGSTHVGLATQFVRQYPWPQFAPRAEELPEDRLYAHAAGIPGTVALYYFPVEYTDAAFLGLRGLPITVGTDEAFAASWLNPRSGALTEVGEVTPDTDGKWLPVGMPDRADWVLVLENRERLAEIG